MVCGSCAPELQNTEPRHLRVQQQRLLVLKGLHGRSRGQRRGEGSAARRGVPYGPLPAIVCPPAPPPPPRMGDSSGCVCGPCGPSQQQHPVTRRRRVCNMCRCVPTQVWTPARVRRTGADKMVHAWCQRRLQDDAGSGICSRHSTPPEGQGCAGAALAVSQVMRCRVHQSKALHSAPARQGVRRWNGQAERGEASVRGAPRRRRCA